jgi:hypothetical protein
VTFPSIADKIGFISPANVLPVTILPDIFQFPRTTAPEQSPSARSGTGILAEHDGQAHVRANACLACRPDYVALPQKQFDRRGLRAFQIADQCRKVILRKMTSPLKCAKSGVGQNGLVPLQIIKCDNLVINAVIKRNTLPVFF